MMMTIMMITIEITILITSKVILVMITGFPFKTGAAPMQDNIPSFKKITLNLHLEQWGD